ncbi:hypothetical protein D3C76_642220 [compost metagenome]
MKGGFAQLLALLPFVLLLRIHGRIQLGDLGLQVLGALFQRRRCVIGLAGRAARNRTQPLSVSWASTQRVVVS